MLWRKPRKKCTTGVLAAAGQQVVLGHAKRVGNPGRSSNFRPHDWGTCPG
jgi:hypothetical protein